ncbi:type-F conjugative transfer system secretin TraK [Parvularcula oceani]|uniref:type-F conjugative transfer system secretin TraK n=1 Tax=Parvularcula oceani TaxID=1247963 RepID=UPI0004E264ED|nr:type-F conjugative transfer system secretin TraK [Parvularcula oceani]
MTRASSLAATLLATASVLVAPAAAQQIVEASDGGVVSGYVSASGVTRLSFTGDKAASAPMAQGGGGPGFALVHEPGTGDLYLTLEREPRPGERAGAVSFFVTTEAGFTYQVELAAKDVPSTQIEVRNVQLGIRRAERAATAAPFEARVVALTRAMWSGALLDGFGIKRPVRRERAAGSLRVAVAAVYESADLTGRVLTVRNSSRGTIPVREDAFLAPGVVAVTLKGPTELGPRQSTQVLVVDRGGAR